MDIDIVLGLLKSIHESGWDRFRWCSVVSQISVHFGASVGALFTWSRAPTSARPVTLYGVDDITTIYRSHFANLDPFRELYAQLPSGKAETTNGLLDYTNFDRSEFFNEFWRPRDMYFGIGVQVQHFITDDTDIALAFYKDQSKEPFKDAELWIMENLIAHLRIALQQSRFLLDAQALASSLEDALDKIVDALIIVNEHLTVAFANQSAIQILKAYHVMRIKGNRLFCCNHNDQRRLEAAILRCSRSSQVRTTFTGDTILMKMIDSDLVVEASVLPLCAPERFEALKVNSGGALIMLTPPGVGANIDDASLRKRFNLTATDLSLARDLLRDRKLADHADAAGITREAARSRLKSLFAKTGTSRQSELVRLLMAQPALKLRRG